MSDIHLRPYQVKFIDDIRQQFKAGHKNVVGVAPCGSGKTIITGWLAREVANNNKRVLFMVHRQELIEQTSKTFFELNLDHGIICSGVQPNYNLPVQIASVQTLVRRLDKVPKPDLLICDECHHVLANNYKKIIDEWKPLLLGVTATPERLGGVTLNDVFSSMVIGPSVGSLIDQGNLARFNYFAPPSAVDTSKIRSSFGEFRSNELSNLMDRQEIIGDVIDSYRQYANNRQTIVYCVNVKHSKHTAELFNQAGITAAHVDGESDKSLRRRIIEDFRDGKIKVLCNAELFGEGFDVPNCDCVILARPTQSLTLFIQQSMRCMRPNPANKNKVAIIIDHVENVKRFGLPDQDRHWSLLPNEIHDNGKAPLKTCPNCHAVVHAAFRTCPACGFKFPFQDYNQKDGKLILFSDSKKDYSNSRADNCIVTSLPIIQTFFHFNNIAIKKNYKSYWALVQTLQHVNSFEDCLAIASTAASDPSFNIKNPKGWAWHKWNDIIHKNNNDLDDFINNWNSTHKNAK